MHIYYPYQYNLLDVAHCQHNPTQMDLFVLHIANTNINRCVRPRARVSVCYFNDMGRTLTSFVINVQHATDVPVSPFENYITLVITIWYGK